MVYMHIEKLYGTIFHHVRYEMEIKCEGVNV